MKKETITTIILTILILILTTAITYGIYRTYQQQQECTKQLPGSQLTTTNTDGIIRPSYTCCRKQEDLDRNTIKKECITINQQEETTWASP